MNIVKYNYLDRPSMDSDTAQVTVRVPDATKKQLHYGLIAQELQEIYPDLVIEGQDGYLGVNYVELVPILIRSIQELKQELDDVKDGGRGIRERKQVLVIQNPSSRYYTRTLPTHSMVSRQFVSSWPITSRK